ncbi:hypothetical protein [Streptomyces sp. NPDC053427]|uniref:wHTH domain-containing protein n=1 Tax=Streptomyces sp. NPDC053427 TaxID=3365701 RepID=UPI0037CDD659
MQQYGHIRNAVTGGAVAGPVVPAGSIGHLSLTHRAAPPAGAAEAPRRAVRASPPILLQAPQEQGGLPSPGADGARVSFQAYAEENVPFLRGRALLRPVTSTGSAAPARTRADRPDVLLLTDLRDPGPDEREWLDIEAPVPPGHLAQAALRLGIPLPQVAAVLRRYGFDARAGTLPAAPDEAALTLLSAEANGRWPWLSLAEPVPPGHVLSAARKLSLGPRGIVEMLSGYGFRPPDPFPADACDADLPLLPRRKEPLTYERLFHAVRATGRGLEEILTRLQAYGFPLPLRPPHRRTALDEELLSPTGPCAAWRMSPAEVLPFARVVVASQEVQATPEEIAARLASYGIRTSGRQLPAGLPYDRALTLLSFYRTWHGVTPVPLQTLLPLTSAMDASLAQVVSWLTGLGVPVADVGEIVRAAPARVPLPDAAPGTTLE